jgi:3-deoxy-7-phosphoheptulonate synthase
MYNYELLKELAQTNKPVLLKRSFSALIDEWLGAADYLVKGGNNKVILCERGIRTFETKMRNTLDLNTVAYIKAHTNYKIYVDPSHGTGHRQYVRPMALAAVAAGADGLIIEVHDDISRALSDEAQAITSQEFADLKNDIKKLCLAVGKTF